MVKSKKLLFNERNPLFPKDPDVGFVSVFYAMQAQCLRLWDRHVSSFFPDKDKAKVKV